MKKTVVSLLSTLAAIFMMTAFHSCSSGPEADTLDLLSAVPSGSEAVIVINMEEAIDGSGAKISNGKISGDANLQRLLGFLAPAPLSKETSAKLLDGSLGIKYSSAVMFMYQGKHFLTCKIDDAKAFRTAIDKIYPGDWKDSADGTSYKNNVAIADDRAWFGNIDPSEIDTFMKFSEIESFKSNDYAEKLAKSSDALSFWASLKGVMQSANMSFSERTVANMALSTFFKDPAFVTGDADIDDDRIDIEMNLLNSKLKKAKCELKITKIDPTRVASLGGNANFVGAVSVSTGLIEQMQKILSSIGGAMPATYSSLLSPLDGTQAIATGESGSEILAGFKANITTNGKENAALAQSLQAFGQVDIQGSDFTVSKGSYGNGELKVEEVAKDFDGAWLGIAAANNSKPDAPRKMILKVSPDDGSLTLKVKLQY